MKTLIALKNWFVKLEGWICLGSLGFMFLIGAMEVLARNIFRKSFYWSQEVIVILLVWEVFMGAAYIFSTSTLISVDVLYEKFGKVGKRVLDIIGDIVIVTILIVILRFGWKYMHVQSTIKTTALGIPQSIYTIPMLIAAVSMLIEILGRVLGGIFNIELKEGS